MHIRFKRRKKQNIIDINKEEFLKELDEHIRWIKERQIKSKEEKEINKKEDTRK
ncbi:MAG: hypothetical protein MUO82_10240 [Candidatus Thermoplasmatota archaeon]|nr:hypothetical protein [Candidatus Thermoplasmatota archaeon]